MWMRVLMCNCSLTTRTSFTSARCTSPAIYPSCRCAQDLPGALTPNPVNCAPVEAHSQQLLVGRHCTCCWARPVDDPAAPATSGRHHGSCAPAAVADAAAAAWVAACSRRLLLLMMVAVLQSSSCTACAAASACAAWLVLRSAQSMMQQHLQDSGPAAASLLGGAACVGLQTGDGPAALYACQQHAGNLTLALLLALAPCLGTLLPVLACQQSLAQRPGLQKKQLRRQPRVAEPWPGTWQEVVVQCCTVPCGHSAGLLLLLGWLGRAAGTAGAEAAAAAWLPTLCGCWSLHPAASLAHLTTTCAGQEE